MAIAKTHKSPSNSKSAPAIDLDFDLPAGSGVRVTRAKLIALMQRAWLLVPASRRPDLKGITRVAVDIHALSDTQIAPLNWKFMRHKGATDVLSFPLGDFDPVRRAYHAGEILVSYDTAKREAAERGLSTDNEFARYCVHGFLHLLGYDDSTPALRKAMFAVQEKALNES